MFRSRFAAAVLAAMPLFWTAGCGGSSSDGGSAPVTEPQLTLSATTLAFNSVTVGQTSASQTVTLTNTGSASLTLSSVTLSDTSNYSMMSTCGASLAVSASCTLSITFHPQNAASLPAGISISDNAGGSPQSISLTGTGTAAAAPQATLSITSLSFGSIAAGSTSTAQSVTLTNGGDATLSNLGVSIGGANAAQFADVSTCTSTLAANASCTVSVTFTPAAASTSYTATLSFTDNAGSSPQTVSLSGSGAAPVPVPVAALSTSSLTFASTNVGSSAGAQAVTLSNTGTAPLSISGISIGGGAASTAFSESTTCGSSLAAGSNCSISVNFTPSTTGSFAGTLSITDNASGSPQTVGLSGTGVAPAASLSTTMLTFPNTTVNATSQAYSATLTNTGGATLTISSIVLGGTNATDFAETTTCGGTLAANASCTISATFTPTTATSYAATITITDNASGSPQTISLSGTGTASAISYTLYTFPESDNSVTPLYALINNAQKTIDMTMYALEDTTFSGDLVAACKRGVTVRMILDQNDEKSGNTAAFNQLNAQTNCSAVWANKAFEATHEKSFVIDGTQAAIMSLNLQSSYYSTTRDFAMIENDPVDIAAIEATFNADYAAGTTSSGTVGTSDFSYTPGLGDDLIWSPTTAQAAMVNIIANAKSSLLIENEELATSASYIISALETACKNGVTLKIAMVDQTDYESNFTAIDNACGTKVVHVYPDTTNGFYIHAKAVVADYGLSTQSVYMGSINYSNASMNDNRELGMYISDSTSVQQIYNTMLSDYNGGTPY